MSSLKRMPSPARERQEDRDDRRDPDQGDVQDGGDPRHQDRDPAVASDELATAARLSVLTAGDAWVSVLDLELQLPRLPPLRSTRGDAPAGCNRRARPGLLAEDGLGLGLHVVEDRVDLRGIRDEVGQRRAGDIRGELRAGVAIEELGHVRRRGDGIEDLLLQRGVARGVGIVRSRHRSRSGPWTGRPPAPAAVPKW